MAKITTEIVWFDVCSRTSGKRATVMQRTSFRLDRVEGRYARTPMRTEFVGPAGETFEKLSGNAVRCVASGEEFMVQGISLKTSGVGQPLPAPSARSFSS